MFRRYCLHGWLQTFQKFLGHCLRITACSVLQVRLCLVNTNQLTLCLSLNHTPSIVSFIHKQCHTGYCVAHLFCPQICHHANMNFVHFYLAKMTRHDEPVMNRIKTKTFNAVTRCECSSTRYLCKYWFLLLSVQFVLYQQTSHLLIF